MDSAINRYTIGLSETEKDEQGLLNFIDEGMDVPELLGPPERSPGCQWCNYIAQLNGTRGQVIWRHLDVL